MDQKTQDRIQKKVGEADASFEAWDKVPDGYQLPSGRIFRRGSTWAFGTATREDDAHVLAEFGGISGGGTVNRDAKSRPSTQKQTAASPSKKNKAVKRDDPNRPKTEQALGEMSADDEALAGVGIMAEYSISGDEEAAEFYSMALAEEGDAEGAAFMQNMTADSSPALEKTKAASNKASKNRTDRYTPQYYSGAQAQIYFGDILIDEIVQFQYTTATNKMPIYGYASELFDTVASGNLLVQGSFVINFVEAGYLAIIAAAIADRSFGGKAIGRRSRQISRSDTGEVLSETLRETSILTPGSYLGNQALNQVRGLGNKEFRALARELNVNKIGKDNKFSHTTRFDLMAPFDIYAIFGDYTDPNADHTVRKLKNVYLTGQGQTITVSGEPVGEQYSFICRTIE